MTPRRHVAGPSYRRLLFWVGRAGGFAASPPSWATAPTGFVPICTTSERRKMALLGCLIQSLEHGQNIRAACGYEQALVKGGICDLGGDGRLTGFAHATESGDSPQPRVLRYW